MFFARLVAATIACATLGTTALAQSPERSKTPPKYRNLTEFIAAMKELELKPAGEQVGSAVTAEEGGNTVTRTPVTSTITVEELAGFNPNVGVLWPGSLVQGESPSHGVLAGIGVRRSPLTLVLSTLAEPAGEGKTRPRSITVRDPSAATVENSRVTLLARGFVVPAKAAQVFREFSSLEQAMMQIGASADYLGNSLRAQLESDKYSKQSNVMVSFVQEFYTLAMEPPKSPTAVFKKVKIADLEPYSDPKSNPIGIIQGVTYGRMGLLFATSSESYEKLRRAIEAHVRFATGGGDASYTDEQRRIVQQSEVKLLLLGVLPRRGSVSCRQQRKHFKRSAHGL